MTRILESRGGETIIWTLEDKTRRGLARLVFESVRKAGRLCNRPGQRTVGAWLGPRPVRIRVRSGDRKRVLINGIQLTPKDIHVAMGQNPNRPPSEHPNPTTKIGQNGLCTYPTHSHACSILEPMC